MAYATDTTIWGLIIALIGVLIGCRSFSYQCKKDKLSDFVKLQEYISKANGDAQKILPIMIKSGRMLNPDDPDRGEIKDMEHAVSLLEAIVNAMDPEKHKVEDIRNWLARFHALQLHLTGIAEMASNKTPKQVIVEILYLKDEIDQIAESLPQLNEHVE